VNATAAPILSLTGLTIAYDGKPAVHGLDLSVAPGEVLSLLGPSGCGKTTTMRAIAGLLQPSAGRIMLAGRDVTSVPANRRGIGLVFQSYALFPHLSAFENVAFGLRLKRLAGAEIAARAGEMLDAVGLGAFASRVPAELSGGQQQRVALARALVMRPPLLLLDEPLSNLDARLRLEMRGELARLQATLGTTMIYVTHDQAEALALSTRVAVMREGRLEQLGPPEQVWERPASLFVARFMGFETILSHAPDGTLAALQGGRPDDAPALPSGHRLLGWRPDSVAVGSGPRSARVIASSYQGRVQEMLLDTPLGLIKAEAPAGLQRVRPGDTLAFDLPLDRATPIPVKP
jgi:putative spermidine/putrescine transport system ATP-binding protein